MNTVALGANEVFWWCSDGAVRTQRFDATSVEPVATLPGRGWLAIDAENMWIAHDDVDPTLYRVPLSGGSLVNLGAVPRGELVVSAHYVWIKEKGHNGALYRVPKSGGVADVVQSDNVTAIAKDGEKILFVQHQYGGRSALRAVDDGLAVTMVLDDIPPSKELVVGGGWAYLLGSVRIDVTKRAVDYPWRCAHPVVATGTRVVMHCADGTVQIANHGSAEATLLPEIPFTRQLFGGPSHICWMVGDKKDKLSCATY